MEALNNLLHKYQQRSTRGTVPAFVEQAEQTIEFNKKYGISPNAHRYQVPVRYVDRQDTREYRNAVNAFIGKRAEINRQMWQSAADSADAHGQPASAQYMRRMAGLPIPKGTPLQEAERRRRDLLANIYGAAADRYVPHFGIPWGNLDALPIGAGAPPPIILGDDALNPPLPRARRERRPVQHHNNPPRPRPPGPPGPPGRRALARNQVGEENPPPPRPRRREAEEGEREPGLEDPRYAAMRAHLPYLEELRRRQRHGAPAARARPQFFIPEDDEEPARGRPRFFIPEDDDQFELPGDEEAEGEAPDSPLGPSPPFGSSTSFLPPPVTLPIPVLVDEVANAYDNLDGRIRAAAPAPVRPRSPEHDPELKQAEAVALPPQTRVPVPGVEFVDAKGEENYDQPSTAAIHKAAAAYLRFPLSASANADPNTPLLPFLVQYNSDPRYNTARKRASLAILLTRLFGKPVPVPPPLSSLDATQNLFELYRAGLVAGGVADGPGPSFSSIAAVSAYPQPPPPTQPPPPSTYSTPSPGPPHGVATSSGQAMQPRNLNTDFEDEDEKPSNHHDNEVPSTPDQKQREQKDEPDDIANVAHNDKIAQLIAILGDPKSDGQARKAASQKLRQFVPEFGKLVAAYKGIAAKMRSVLTQNPDLARVSAASPDSFWGRLKADGYITPHELREANAILQRVDKFVYRLETAQVIVGPATLRQARKDLYDLKVIAQDLKEKQHTARNYQLHKRFLKSVEALSLLIGNDVAHTAGSLQDLTNQFATTLERYNLRGNQLPFTPVKGAPTYKRKTGRGIGALLAQRKRRRVEHCTLMHFGRFLIRSDLLRLGRRIHLKNPGSGLVPKGFPIVHCSEPLQLILLSLLDNPNKSIREELDTLQPEEIEYLGRLIQASGIFGGQIAKRFGRSLPSATRGPLRRMELLVGEIQAGNDNDDIQREAQSLLLRLQAGGQISRAQFRQWSDIVVGHR